MYSRIMETLETLEEKIENIKWLVTTPFSLKVSGISEAITIIRKSAGILNKNFPKGTVCENKVRGNWEANSLKRRN